MPDYSDSDILITTEDCEVLLTLTCGYGQPVATTVYLQETGGATSEITSFNSDITDLKIGDSTTLNKKRIIVFSTIHDIRDANPGQEVEDIHLDITVTCGNVSVDTSFIKKTKGIGTLVNCKYEVILFKQ